MIFRPTKIPRHVERLISVPYVGFSFWDRGGQRDDRFCQHWPRRSWIQLLCAGSICSFVTETFHVPWGAQPPIVVQCNVPSVPVPALAIHLSGRLRVGAPAPSLTLRRTVGRTRAAQQSPRSASAPRRRRYKQERCLDLRLLPDPGECLLVGLCYEAAMGVPTEMPSVLACRRGRAWCGVVLHRAGAGRPSSATAVVAAMDLLVVPTIGFRLLYAFVDPAP